MTKPSQKSLTLAKRPNVRLIFFIVLALISALVLWKVVLPALPHNTSPSASVPSALPVAPASETKQSPWRLQISSIKLDAAIQEVGLTKNGDMGVPSNYTDVGWLKTGPRPGQPGNAVLAGHLNSGVNKPAVFENLHKLKPGDIVTVKDKAKNEQQRFKVTSAESYDVTTAPLEKIFGATEGSHLNLITCSGKWDKTKKDYNQRLVVFSELLVT